MDTSMNDTAFAPDGPIASAAWLRQHLPDPSVQVIDVRPADAYQSGHIPGARTMDLSMLRLPSSAPAAIEAWKGRLRHAIRQAGITAEARVIFYEDISGTMAAFGVWLLDAAGLRNGALLDGGLRRWLAEGGELDTEAVTATESSTEIAPDASVIATADALLDGLRSSDRTQTVDARSAAEHRQGAIPGAVNIDWTRHLDADGAFRPRADLARLYDTAGLDRDEPVASYCAGGFRAAHTYVALRAIGFDNVANYAPSWGEWGQRPDAPKQRG